MKFKTTIYDAPECEVVLVQTASGILSGSDNMLGKPDDYQNSGEGFEW